MNLMMASTKTSRPSTSKALVKAKTSTTNSNFNCNFTTNSTNFSSKSNSSIANSTRTTESRTESLLYSVTSDECFASRDYQRQCLQELYGRLCGFPGHSQPNIEELTRLLAALALQMPDFRPPLPAYLVPLIRFDAGKVPYFEFHGFSAHLPLMRPLTGLTKFLATVDDLTASYSQAIFKLMMDYFWATQAASATNNRSVHTVLQKNLQQTVHVQESAGSSGFCDDSLLSGGESPPPPKRSLRSRRSLDFSFELSPTSKTKLRGEKELPSKKSSRNSSREQDIKTIGEVKTEIQAIKRGRGRPRKSIS